MITYKFIEDKKRIDLEGMQIDELIDAYISLQESYNTLEEDFSLKILEDL